MHGPGTPRPRPGGPGRRLLFALALVAGLLAAGGARAGRGLLSPAAAKKRWTVLV